MRNVLLTLLHLAVMAAKLCGPGGVRAVSAENLLLKQQLIVLRRARQRAPNLRRSDRLLCGFWSLFLSPGRIRTVAVALRQKQPSSAGTRKADAMPALEKTTISWRYTGGFKAATTATRMPTTIVTP